MSEGPRYSRSSTSVFQLWKSGATWPSGGGFVPDMGTQGDGPGDPPQACPSRHGSTVVAPVSPKCPGSRAKCARPRRDDLARKVVAPAWHGLGPNVQAGKWDRESGKIWLVEAIVTAILVDAGPICGLSRVVPLPADPFDPRGGGYQRHYERLAVSGPSTRSQSLTPTRAFLASGRGLGRCSG